MSMFTTPEKPRSGTPFGILSAAAKSEGVERKGADAGNTLPSDLAQMFWCNANVMRGL
jgi:hypothetical protein